MKLKAGGTTMIVLVGLAMISAAAPISNAAELRKCVVAEDPVTCGMYCIGVNTGIEVGHQISIVSVGGDDNDVGLFLNEADLGGGNWAYDMTGWSGEAVCTDSTILGEAEPVGGTLSCDPETTAARFLELGAAFAGGNVTAPDLVPHATAIMADCVPE